MAKINDGGLRGGTCYCVGGYSSRCPLHQEVWVDLDEAPRETMEIVFAQYREKVRAELCQIKNDLDHYNSYRNKDGEPIKFIFDFREDIDEHLVMDGGKRVHPPIDKGIRLLGRDPLDSISSDAL